VECLIENGREKSPATTAEGRGIELNRAKRSGYWSTAATIANRVKVTIGSNAIEQAKRSGCWSTASLTDSVSATIGTMEMDLLQGSTV
jgi:hypothetical protein